MSVAAALPTARRPALRSDSPLRIPPVLALAVPVALGAAPVASAAQPPGKGAILGFTTTPCLGIPPVQAKPGRTLRNCLTRPTDNRDFGIVWQIKGISRSSRVGIAVWGGPPSAGFAARPKIADVARNATRWGKGPATKIFTQSYGFTFEAGPFGPQQIDGKWSAMVAVDGKSRAFASITVASA